MQAVQLGQEGKQRLVSILKERLGERLLALVLFGSRARRTPQEESDWDVLAVATDLPESPADEMRLLTEGSRFGFVGRAGVMFRSPEWLVERLPSVCLDIALDGEILYDPQGIAARRLASLRKLIRDLGLYREQTPAGHVWRWRNQPVPWRAWREWVQPTDDEHYRLDLAEKHLADAQRLLPLEMWRSSVDQSQMAAENAAKAALALLGPVGRTHDPAVLLHLAVTEGRFPEMLVERVERLATCAERLGSQLHSLVTYGEEAARRTPWDLFKEEQARELIALAEEAVRLARDIVEAS